MLLHAFFGPYFSFLFAISLAAFIGLLSGYLVWFFRLPSLLVRLSFLFLYRGLVEYVTGGKTMTIPPETQESAALLGM